MHSLHVMLSTMAVPDVCQPDNALVGKAALVHGN
jgi:hypothetical protein